MERNVKNNIYLHVIVADFNYIIPLAEVIEARLIPMITPKVGFNEQDTVVGEIEYCQQRITVIDAALALGLRNESHYTLDNFLVLCQYQSTVIGLLVDKVVGLWNAESAARSDAIKMIRLSVGEAIKV